MFNWEIVLLFMKYIMCVLKGNNNWFKYVLEILRFFFL